MQKEHTQNSYFNEIHGPDGQVREHYAEVYRHWRSLPGAVRRSLHRGSARHYSGDYAQDPLPRILTEPELQLLRRGVDQRARAVLAFLQSYGARDSRWKRIIPPRRLNAILLRHGCDATLQKLKPEQIAFPFGPDLIRNRRGQWRVVEDSAGILGGIGDLVHARRILFRQVPEFRSALSASPHPREFFQELARHFTRKAEEKGGIPLLYLRAFRDEADRETQRLARIFQSMGMEAVTSANPGKRLEVGKHGVFLKSGSGRKRVGALVFHAGPEQHDARALHLLLRRIKTKDKDGRQTILLADFLQAFDGPPIQKALLQGQAWSNFSPGVQFVNDKGFGIYVDSLIRKLLQERPILESLPASSAARRMRAGQWLADRALLAELRKDRGRFVVKVADEDGGGGVWIGRKESRDSLEKLLPRIHSEPERFIIQEYEHLSVLENRIVDLRIHAHVDAERIIVSGSPWGRATWLHGNGKVNIGSKGFASPVVVVREGAARV
jgi:uncharacterized circularly permuted ATP-grasp superfamily protein